MRPSLRHTAYEQLARIGNGLASPRRLELLDLLAQGPRTVQALAHEAGIGIVSASQHLKVLRQARLVEATKQGLYVTYRLADPGVERLCRDLRLLGEQRLLEIERVKRQFLDGREGMEPLDREALLRRVRGGEATVLDVRPAEEYRAGHIPGAISIPLPELKRRLLELPQDTEIVAYCRGPYCLMAVEAVALLRREGLSAVRLEDGVTDWKARGWRVETDRQATATAAPTRRIRRTP